MFDPRMMQAMTGGELTDDNYFANYNGIMGAGPQRKRGMMAPPGPPGTAPMAGLSGMTDIYGAGGGMPSQSNQGLAQALMAGGNPGGRMASGGVAPMADDSLPVGEGPVPVPGQPRAWPGQQQSGQGMSNAEKFDKLMQFFGGEPGYFTNFSAQRQAAAAAKPTTPNAPVA